MIVNYDADDQKHIANCTISLGLPEIEIEDMKKTTKNPFK